MSNATIVGATFIAALIAACATGGSSDGNDHTDAAVSSHADASAVTTPDAARSDAGAGQDAQVSTLVDASMGSGSGSGGNPFCSLNTDCTVAGECCVTLGGPSGFCAPGDVVLGQCFPQ